MLNRLCVGAALAVALAGCRRAPDAPVSVTSALEAPAPSSAVVTSPPDSGASAYTNEMQAENLRAQAAELGIARLAKPSTAAEFEQPRPRRTITRQEGIALTREMAREAEAARLGIEGDKNRPIAIPTETPGLIPGDNKGSPIETAP